MHARVNRSCRSVVIAATALVQFSALGSVANAQQSPAGSPPYGSAPPAAPVYPSAEGGVAPGYPVTPAPAAPSPGSPFRNFFAATVAAVAATTGPGIAAVVGQGIVGGIAQWFNRKLPSGAPAAGGYGTPYGTAGAGSYGYPNGTATVYAPAGTTSASTVPSSYYPSTATAATYPGNPYGVSTAGATSYPSSTPYPGTATSSGVSSYPAATTYPSATSYPTSTSYPSATSYPTTTGYPSSTPYPGAAASASGYPSSPAYPSATSNPATTTYPGTAASSPTPGYPSAAAYPGTAGSQGAASYPGAASEYPSTTAPYANAASAAGAAVSGSTPAAAYNSAAGSAGAGGGLYAGVAYEVHLLDAAGNSSPVDTSAYAFRSGDRFLVYYRPSMPGSMQVYNVNATGSQTKIDEARMAAGQLMKLGPYEFAGASGDESLVIVLTPCSSPELLAATRDIVNVSATAGANGTASNRVALSTCGTATRGLVQTRDIRKVGIDGPTSYALDPVSTSEISSGQLAPRRVTISFRHR